MNSKVEKAIGAEVNIEQTIRKFLMSELKENGFHKGIGNHESLIEAKIMDSLGVLTTISFLEDTFGIISSEDELDRKNFKSVNAIVKFVEKKLRQQIQ